VGHPCVGCTEKSLAFQVPIHTTVDIERPTPPDTYPPINAEHGGPGPVATAVGGAVVGAALGAAWTHSKKLDKETEAAGKEE
jgi:hydrogenase small subunit